SSDLLTGGDLSNTNNRNRPVLLTFSPDVRPPLFTSQPTSLFVLETNTTVIFSATFTGAPPISVQWFLNPSNALSAGVVVGESSTTLSIPALRTNVGFYRVVISNHF